QSPWPRAISATGTISPSTWQLLCPKWNSVMSRRRGASRHPESLTRFLTSSGAPHVSQVLAVGRFWLLHHWHSIRCAVSIAQEPNSLRPSPASVSYRRPGDRTEVPCLREHGGELLAELLAEPAGGLDQRLQVDPGPDAHAVQHVDEI